MTDGGNGGMKTKAAAAADQASATHDELYEPEFKIPAHRVFVVRNYNRHDEWAETTVEAHIIQPNERGMVCFYDLERTAAGEPTMRLHRTFWNVEEVEEVLRVPPVERRIIAH